METKLKITLKVRMMDFSAVTENIAEAYRYIEAIVLSYPAEFQDKDFTLSEYMGFLVEFRDAGKIMCENHIFRVEVV